MPGVRAGIAGKVEYRRKCPEKRACTAGRKREMFIMRGTADERSESLRFTETGDGNRNAGKLLLIEKQERHWKPVSSGAGYWVCQDLWELVCGKLRLRSTGSEAGGLETGRRHHLGG